MYKDLISQISEMSRTQAISFARGLIGVCTHSDDFNMFQEAVLIDAHGCIENAAPAYKKDLEYTIQLLIDEVRRTQKHIAENN